MEIKPTQLVAVPKAEITGMNQVQILESQAMQSIQLRHKTVSRIVTPRMYIYRLPHDDFDYIDKAWMKYVADQYYPGWTFLIIEKDKLIENGLPSAYEITGRLKWWEDGIWREGDMSAAHRIQRNSAGKLVNPGNDLKAAVTDCLKKALNTYLNIGDDVYMNQVERWEINEKETQDLLNAADKVDDIYRSMNYTTPFTGQIQKKLDDNIIHPGNLETELANLKYQYDIALQQQKKLMAEGYKAEND